MYAHAHTQEIVKLVQEYEDRKEGGKWKRECEREENRGGDLKISFDLDK